MLDQKWNWDSNPSTQIQAVGIPCNDLNIAPNTHLHPNTVYSENSSQDDDQAAYLNVKIPYSSV